MMATTRETIADRAKRWHVAMKDADTGPLRICEDVVSVIDAWESHKVEAGGVTAEAWLVSVFRDGRGVGYWRARSKALGVLEQNRDGSARRTLDHFAAVWLSKRPASSRTKTFFRCMQVAAEQKSPVGKIQAVRIEREITGTKPREKKCAACSRLRAILARHGIAEE